MVTRVLLATMTVVVFLALGACTTPDQRVSGLERQNENLHAELREMAARDAAITRERDETRAQLARQTEMATTYQAQNEVLRGAVRGTGQNVEDLEAQARRIAEAQLAVKAAEGRLLEQMAEAERERAAARDRIRRLEEQLAQREGMPPQPPREPVGAGPRPAPAPAAAPAPPPAAAPSGDQLAVLEAHMAQVLKDYGAAQARVEELEQQLARQSGGSKDGAAGTPEAKARIADLERQLKAAGEERDTALARLKSIEDDLSQLRETAVSHKSAGQAPAKAVAPKTAPPADEPKDEEK